MGSIGRILAFWGEPGKSATLVIKSVWAFKALNRNAGQENIRYKIVAFSGCYYTLKQHRDLTAKVTENNIDIYRVSNCLLR